MITDEDRTKFSEIRKCAASIEWDFQAAPGDTIREKAAKLYDLVNNFKFDSIIGGAETIALLEISGCSTELINDILFPPGELLFIGADPKLIIIKNFAQ